MQLSTYQAIYEGTCTLIFGSIFTGLIRQTHKKQALNQ